MKSILFISLMFFLSCDSNDEDSKNKSSSNQPSIDNIMPKGVDIYVSDAGNFNQPPWTIIKYDENGKNPIKFITTHLSWPQDILFLDSLNVVLISNLNTGRITKYNSSNGAYINDFASGLGQPTRMKIGPDGLIYVLQWRNTENKVMRFKTDGTRLDDFTSSGVGSSIGLDWDYDKNLYVSSYYGGYVQKFDSLGNNKGQFISEQLLGPTNIWFDDKGDLLVSDYDGGAIKRFDKNGTFKNNYIIGLGKSEGIDVYENGFFLVGNGQSKSVKAYNNQGKYIKDFVSTGLGGLIAPNAIVIRRK